MLFHFRRVNLVKYFFFQAWFNKKTVIWNKSDTINQNMPNKHDLWVSWITARTKPQFYSTKLHRSFRNPSLWRDTFQICIMFSTLRSWCAVRVHLSVDSSESIVVISKSINGKFVNKFRRAELPSVTHLVLGHKNILLFSFEKFSNVCAALIYHNSSLCYAPVVIMNSLNCSWKREIRVRKMENRMKGETWYYTPCGRRMKQFPEIVKVHFLGY